MSTSAKLNVVIGGGTGLIGRVLTSKLLSKKANVRIITRDPKRNGDLSWQVVESCGLPEDTNVVINLAGRNIGEARIPPRCLLESCEDHPDFSQKYSQDTRTFINASAIGFYEPHLSRCYTEDDPSVDYGFLARLVHDWEAACSGTQLKGVQRVLVRTGNAYLRLTFTNSTQALCASKFGLLFVLPSLQVSQSLEGIVLSKNGGALSKMYLTHRLGLGGPIGSGQQWLSWIHIDDLVNLYCFLIMNPAGLRLSDAVNGTAPCPVRQGAFSHALSEALGAPSIGEHIPMPAFMIRAIMGKERAPLLLEGQKVLPVKAQAAGFEFNFPTLELAFENIYGKRPQPVPTN